MPHILLYAKYTVIRACRKPIVNTVLVWRLFVLPLLLILMNIWEGGVERNLSFWQQWLSNHLISMLVSEN